MYRNFLICASAAAVLFINGAASAARVETAPKPVRAAAAPLKRAATAQVLVGVPEYTEFDVFSTVNDPLYREGSLQLLERSIKPGAKPAKKEKAEMRDAPVSKEAAGAEPLKKTPKPRKLPADKPVQADPVKAKNSL